MRCVILRLQRIKIDLALCAHVIRSTVLFTIYNDADTGSTLVSNLFIDEYMKNANDAQIKVYLYLLRMMSARRTTSISDMADQFNHTEKEVLRSLRYWERLGLLSLDEDHTGNIIGIRMRQQSALGQPLPRAQQEPPAREVPAKSSRVIPMSASPAAAPSADPAPAAPEKQAPSPERLRDFCADEHRSQLLFVIEQNVGKPLAPREIETVYYISEVLHFSDDLIDYLLQYCVDRGKKDFRYIERVAVNWAENGITTPRQAERASSGGIRKARTGRAADVRPERNRFNQIEQHEYDFDELERDLLGS